MQPHADHRRSDRVPASDAAMTGCDSRACAENGAVICVDLPDLQATAILGRVFGSLLRANDVVSLQGPLGAGKTALVREIAPALGCAGHIASPTYLYLMEHPAAPGGLALHHFDVYRLQDGQAFLDLGFDEVLDDGGVSLIEWGDRVASVLPERTIVLQIVFGEQETEHEPVSCGDAQVLTGSELTADGARRVRLVWPVRDARGRQMAPLLREHGLTDAQTGECPC